MAVCIETVKKYPLHDYRTPVFIFERLCSIIYPEENDVGEFFLTLEKDPQQEDFLQASGYQDSSTLSPTDRPKSPHKKTLSWTELYDFFVLPLHC